MELDRSQFVVSLAGRDRGRLFFVVDIDPVFVYLADGKLRRVESPKKKKRKHVQFFSAGDERLTTKFRETGKVTNSEIRRALSPHIAQREMPLQAEGGNLLG